MEEHDHECLWNGPIWPFATSQVLTALAEKKQMDADFLISNEEYTRLLHDYAASHKRTMPDGKIIDWIDENINPQDGSWLARGIPDSWNYFKVENLHIHNKKYTILFDRDGTRYGQGTGIIVRETF